MMIKSITALFLVLASTFAQANSATDVQLLKTMLPKACLFSGEFTQTKQIKTLPVPLISDGEFVYSCDLGLIWKTQQPVSESLVFTNQKLHFLVQDKLSIENLEGVQHDFLANLLLGLMAGNTDFLFKEFDISALTDKQNTLILQPKNKMVKQTIASVKLKKHDPINGLEITISDNNQQTTKIISTEKQQFASVDELSKHCQGFATKSCKLLLNPDRIRTSGK